MMILRSLMGMVLAWCALAIAPAHAAITCSAITSPAVSLNYTTNTSLTSQSYFRVTCDRPNNDPQTSVTYTVKTTRGTPFSGQNKQLGLGASRLSYLTASASACTPDWKQNVTISGTMTWAAGVWGSQSVDSPYWICLSPQTPPAAGVYTSTFAMDLTYPAGTLSTDVTVSVLAPATCTFTTQPGSISVLGYVPFTSGSRSSSTPFWVQCTNTMQYSMATDVAEGVLAGLRYTIAVSSPTGVGTGAPQNYSVLVTVPGGQAGGWAPTCPLPAGSVCSETRNHTIVVTY